MAEAAFSEDGKYYSTISADGRLKIWDTQTNVLKQEYTPDLHLAAPPKCLQWITVAQNTGQTPKRGKNRGSISETESQCIALGTTNGKVLVYSVALAKIQVVLQGKKTKISALDWHRKYGLYSCCGRENLVTEWDLQTASVRNSYNVAVDSKSKQGNVISAIKIVPHSLESSACYLVTASWQVRLWRLNTGEATVLKTLGHNASQTAVLSVATFNDHCWLIEGSQNERLLSFWDVTVTDDEPTQPQTNGDPTPSKKKRRKSASEQRKSLTDVPVVTNASYNFVLEDAPRTVDVELKEEDGAMRLNLVAATRSGVVHYYGQMLNGSSIKPLKPSVTLQATTAEASPIPLQCCRLQESGDLLLGYSIGPLMTFETVTPDLKSKTQVLIRGDTKLGKKVKQSQTNEINKVRTDVHSNNAAVVEPMGGVSRKRVAPGAQVEVPMEARLANLALDVKERGPAAVNQNLTKLLMQGLRSKDKSILSLVLNNNDDKVATRTVGALPPECVPLLLEELVDRATQKTTTCASVCTWLAALTARHAALLLATAPRADQLARLLAVFTHRRSHLCQLLNLRGRVELTIKQRASSHQHKQLAPVLQYNDTSSEEEEEEMKVVEKYKSDSEQSWNDDQVNSEADDDDDDKMEQDGDVGSSGDDDSDDE